MRGYTCLIRKHYMIDEEKNYFKGCFYVILKIKFISKTSLFFYFKEFLWLFVPLYNTIALNVTVTDTIANGLSLIKQMSQIHVPKASAHFFKRTSPPFKNSSFSLYAPITSDECHARFYFNTASPVRGTQNKWALQIILYKMYIVGFEPSHGKENC